MNKVTKRKNIYMNDPLVKLSEKMDSFKGGFSRRLGEIVERYGILLDLEPIPEFSPEDLVIVNSVVSSDYVTARTVESLHIDVRYSEAGSDAERNILSQKIERLTPGQRLVLIERACGKDGE
ncbi:hypothetical protein [Megasphaera massiliensis]|uniref:hypothetical protein n=1 Tax=Megasphaera massiliensis TaxID=1232428 RepID=UPI0005C82EC5|nr:hypothetical protein [Megasphaera massiliensis]